MAHIDLWREIQGPFFEVPKRFLGFFTRPLNAAALVFIAKHGSTKVRQVQTLSKIIIDLGRATPDR